VSTVDGHAREDNNVSVTDVIGPHVATTPAEIGEAARLLDAFNREFNDATPGTEVLQDRLVRLLSDGHVVALLVGESPMGVALVTLRPNVWYDGPVGLLDERYVEPDRRNKGLGTLLLKSAERLVIERGGQLLEISVDSSDTDARRFYERHGYTCGSSSDELALYYSRELSLAPRPNNR
jgi:GNAT superfamily N-acetyltransferase